MYRTSQKKERGSLYPQIMLTVTLCIGALSFGQIFNWGGPTLKHLDNLTYIKMRDPDNDYAWVTCAAPLGNAIGIAVWEFLTTRIGPKRTLLCQMPLMLFSWFLMGVFKSYEVYWTAHFLAAFCSASYIFAGEVFLLDCVHRNNIKIFFAFFKSSIILGVVSMNIFATFFEKTWLCVICGNLAIICFALTMILPDSPRYLILKSETDAEDSLIYYLGKNVVSPELNIVRQHVYFLNYTSYSNIHMLSSKVVLKAILIITLLQFFKICTGYYAFILDSVRIFGEDNDVTSPYGDNVIFGFVLLITKFIGCFVHLHINFGVKKPMMISMFLCSVVLGILGIMEFLAIEKIYRPKTGTMLIILCVFAITYDIGMNICPDIMLYAYTPYQVYDFLKKVMAILQWILIFIVVRAYMVCQMYLGIYVTLWILTGITMIGFIFITAFIVDTKGKSLMNIQMELGGNPVGTRGSSRQRAANPFEPVEDMYFLENLIAADIAANTQEAT